MWGKVQELSNAVHRSTKLADIAEEITGTTFLNPTATRWSSDYDAIKRMYEIGLERIRQCQKEMKLKAESMTDADMNFLSAYLDTMGPVAKAMKLLQQEEAYLGSVIPIILGIQDKLKSVTVRNQKSMTSLIQALNNGLTSRFSSILESEEYKIASILVPAFKMDFISSAAEKRNMKEKLINAVCQASLESGEATDIAAEVQVETKQARSQTEALDASDDFFSFMRNSSGIQQREENVHTVVSDEVNRYLGSTDKHVSLLNQFPHLKQCFVKYNCTLPSGAVVERLFSSAGQILTPRRCRLSNNRFQELVILKSVSKYGKL